MNADDLLDAEITKRSEADVLTRERRINRKLQREYEALLSRVKVAEAAAGSRAVRIPRRKSKSKGKKPHTQVGLISDTHTFEIVDAERVNGYNHHTPEIGKARLVKLFEDTAEQWKRQSKWADVQDLCLCLMGDYLVNNEMHPPDSNEAVHVSPLTEMSEVGAILKGGIEYLVKYTDAHIHIPCVPGNHGRVGKIKRMTKQADYSFEHFMHVDIAAHFKGHDRVTVDAGLDRHKLVNVGGLEMLVIHGDPLLRGGAGLYNSFNRAFTNLRKIYRTMDIMVAGHVHTAAYVASKGFVNGALVGTNEYAHTLGLEPEEPSQWAFLVDHETRRVGTSWRYWPSV